MSISVQYASTPVIGSANTLTADTSYTAPTTSSVGVIAQSTTTGFRIDNIDNISIGTSVAGLHRLFIREGNISPTISSITSSTTTATLTTATNHNLITGDIITLRGAFPVEYNVTNAAVTVTNGTVFTFTIVSTGSVAARDVGAYSSCHTVPMYRLVKETAITAITASTTVAAFAYQLTTPLNPEILPIILPPGWALCSTVSTTQTSTGISSTARGGVF